MDKLQCINYFVERNILVSPDFFDVEDLNFKDLFNDLVDLKSRPLVFNKDLIEGLKIKGTFPDINWFEFDTARVDSELGGATTIYDTFLNIIKYGSDGAVKKSVDVVIQEVANESEILDEEEFISDEGVVVVTQSYQDKPKKKEVKDFVGHFRARYDALKKILLARTELQDSVSINRLYSKNEGERVSIIGLVVEKNKTKNGNIIATIEDTTGTIKVLFNKTKNDIFEIADNLVLDETVGIDGALGNKILFSNGLYLPDVPVSHELKKFPGDEVYAAFIGDIHLGSHLFQENDFMKFIKWVRGDYGSDKHKEIARKLKYIFIVGDLVEGVGIFPGQENDLVIKDVKLQYDALAKYLSLVPKHIKMIACGGNHDAMRIAEPQPVFDKKFAGALYEVPNLVMVSNPSMINIHSQENFPGFDVLMYHGFSFPYYSDNVHSIRSEGGMSRSDLIMKYLLQRRHLCPTHTANLYLPDSNKDHLVIDKVPDFFVTGHIHKITVANYRNVTMLNCSCWDTQSSEQERRGIVPDPAKVPIINLKTRQIRIMNFLGGKNEGSK